MENDLTSRSAAIEALLKQPNTLTRSVVRRVLRQVPGVDAVEVVRCKDCIHYEMGVCLKIYSDGAVSEYAWQERKPNDFCSYGERREENG